MGTERAAAAAASVRAGDLEAAARALLRYYDDGYNFRVQREGRAAHLVAAVAVADADGEGDVAAAALDAARALEKETTCTTITYARWRR
jgi:hypothetical protein